MVSAVAPARASRPIVFYAALVVIALALAGIAWIVAGCSYPAP
jgi:hypothetical protein